MNRFGICVGACLIVAQLVMAWMALRVGTKKQKAIALGMDVLSVIGNALIAVYYNNMPGKGKAPGLTYLGQTVVAMGLMVVSFVVLLVTIVAVVKKRE